jgi:hypothetical protein
VTRDEALANAARLLQAAEGETNLSLLAELRMLADSWVAVADVLSRESV